MLSMRGILFAPQSSAEVMRLFANLRSCHHQPPVQGRFARLSRTSKPGQSPLPRFSVHQTSSARKQHSVLTLPVQQQPKRPQRIRRLPSHLDDFVHFCARVKRAALFPRVCQCGLDHCGQSVHICDHDTWSTRLVWGVSASLCYNH